MNKNTKKTNLTSDNSSFLRSVSKETKEHFDSLLKKALHKNDILKKEVNSVKRSIKKLHKTKFIDKESKTETESDKHVDTHQSPGRENFILEKFLLDAVNSKKEINVPTEQKETEPTRKLLNSVTFIKHPVPLPRTTDSNYNKSTSPFSKQGTYSISSPVLPNADLLNDIERSSTCSRNTYDVTNPKVVIGPKDEDNISDTSHGTYNIYKDKKPNTRANSREFAEIYFNKTVVPVGDIVIHNHSPKSKSTVKIINKNKKQKSTSTSTDDDVSKASTRSSKIHYESEKSKQRKEKSEIDKLSVQNEQIDTHSTSNKSKTTNAGSIEFKDLISETKTGSRKERQERKKATESISIDEPETSFKEPLFTYEDLIGVVVYKTDKLALNSLISHPCVKIHIVDSETGEYLTRSKEIDGSHRIKHIYPLITKSYKLEANRSFIPYWEELMVFTDDFEYMLECKESVIIFFEVLDFLSFSAASINYNKEGSNCGWHKVAWAFLKLVSKTGQLNTEQKIRLQLYKPKRTVIKKIPTECILYDWWCKGPIVKYPSTLHVSVKRVKATSLKETKHSDAIFKSELGLNIIEKDEDSKSEVEDPEIAANDDDVPQVKWSRMSNQSCKIPNIVKAKLKSAKKGCFALKFSNNGVLVACGVADEEKFAIFVYSVLDKHKQQEYCRLAGHNGIIYNLCWSSDDKYLISSSADCTVYIWNVFKRQYYPKQVLPHPAFVYCAQLNEDLIQIITGCYDQVLRIWKSTAVDSEYELLQELDVHTGYITSLCHGENQNVFYSSDSVGIIIEWNFNNKEWILKRTLKFKDLEKTVINNIMLHPGGKRMLVFCRDSTHRMIDLSVGCIVQWYRGALNYRVHTNGCLSACGSLVFAPSEDGSVVVWNTDTGSLLTSYNPYIKISKDVIVPHCIHYHPFDHIVAISHYGSPVPILFCSFDNNATGSDFQLKNSTVTKKQIQEKKIKKISSINMEKVNVKKHTKSDHNLSFDVIIDKIDNVLVSAKSD